MQLKTILNYVEKHKGFVYLTPPWAQGSDKHVMEIPIRPRKGSRPICSGCHRKGACYDRRAVRRFAYVRLWQIQVFFVYVMRRVKCAECGVKVEQVPWADGKNQLTNSYRWFLATWARHLSWKEVAEVFHTTWENVFRSVKHAVAWGLSHRHVDGITALGVDESQWQRGHKYLTLVYQIDGMLKRRENLTRKQTVKLRELVQYNLKSVRSYLLREDFQRFWNYVSPTWAGKFLHEWCTRTMRSKIAPMKKMARTLRSHRQLILNWFHAKGTISSGIVEGFNNKVKLTTRKSYGFRTYDAIETALYHNLGNLPEPKLTHRFC